MKCMTDEGLGYLADAVLFLLALVAVALVPWGGP
jgi:hypothetical protein